MDRRDGKRLPAVGFLTVVRNDQHGLLGGYLVLNVNGRPLEFHCTAPVKPNRAQEILFGPALEPYLYGEQIGQTLIAKSEVQPLAVCTDLAAVLAVRQFVSLPVALVLPAGLDDRSESCEAAPLDGQSYRVDSSHPAVPLAAFRLGRNRLAVPSGSLADRASLASNLESIADTFDLAEPFERIRNAIDEARRSTR
jgi:hypothetical protein